MSAPHRQGLLIELVDPLITTASSATATVPEALPFIPGAMLLGAAAAAGYGGGMAQETAFALFHSGRVRFDDALPVDNSGRVGLPAPFSLHFPKGTHPLEGDVLKDFSAAEPLPGYEQLRDRALAAGPAEVTVRIGGTMRTAIDPATGRAADSQLFGYQFLKPGQRFWAGIEAEDQASLDAAMECLLGKGQVEAELILGRARSGEFGRVRLSRCEAPEMSPGSTGSPTTRWLWLLSDLWATGPKGLPTLRPDSAFFGGGNIDWSRSFTRSRRYSPFNAKWQARAPERVLIQRGSVIVIQNSPLAPGLWRLGLGQEQGLGRMLVLDQPPLEMLKASDAAMPELSALHEPDSRENADSDAPPPLITWLKRQANVVNIDVSDDLKKLKGHYETAERIHGERVGPTPSQWGSIRSILERGGDHAAYLGGVRGTGEKALWGAQYKEGDNHNFADFITAVIADKGARHAALLARDARRWLDREGWFDGH